MSQGGLAEALGLTFQQVQKYERGSNRVSASMLFATARALRVSPSHFFEGLPDPEDGSDPETHSATIAAESLLGTPDGRELAQGFPKIRSRSTRAAVLRLVRSMVGEDQAAAEA
jgi:transcriptional regulator with XRE-family HTH domain